MKPKLRRPQHCSREITTHWPGITYPDEFGCQVRLTVGDTRPSRYFPYSDFKGDAVAAHRAAMLWRMNLAKKHRKVGAEATKLKLNHQRWLDAGGARVMARGARHEVQSSNY